MFLIESIQKIEPVELKDDYLYLIAAVLNASPYQGHNGAEDAYLQVSDMLKKIDPDLVYAHFKEGSLCEVVRTKNTNMALMGAVIKSFENQQSLGRPPCEFSKSEYSVQAFKLSNNLEAGVFYFRAQVDKAKDPNEKNAALKQLCALYKAFYKDAEANKIKAEMYSLRRPKH